MAPASFLRILCILILCSTLLEVSSGQVLTRLSPVDSLPVSCFTSPTLLSYLAAKGEDEKVNILLASHDFITLSGHARQEGINLDGKLVFVRDNYMSCLLNKKEISILST